MGKAGKAELDRSGIRELALESEPKHPVG